jgi:hypothetical protein
MRDVNSLSDHELLSFVEAATLIGLSRSAISLAVKNGKIRPVKSGPYDVIMKKDALAYRDSERKPGWPIGKSRKPTEIKENKKRKKRD